MRVHLILSGLFLVAAALPAVASGGLSCTAEDKSIRFNVEAGITSGMGGPTFNLRGQLDILDKVVAEDLRSITFGDADRPQYWLDDKELRLLLYKERAGDKPFGSVELELRAGIADEEGTFRGTYALSVYDLAGSGNSEGKTTTLKGDISCFVE